MKYSVSSYSYSQLRSSGAYTEIELIALAKEMGFDAIEFAEIHTPEGKDKLAYAAELKAEAERVGIEIACYCIGADFLKNENQVEDLKKEIDVAAALGVERMRHDATSGFADGQRGSKGFDQALPILADGCRAVTEYAQTKGIRTMVENHGFFCQDSERVEKLVNAVAHENFGALVDIGNFLCADEDPAVAVGRMAPYAFHVHAKDFHVKNGNGVVPPDGYFRSRGGNALRGAIIGHGDVPVLQCLRILDAHGYDGYITVEFEGMEEAKKGVACGLRTLKYFDELL
ncbi:MAG: sugar phosphate isomerase/epimerase [Clostridia bacterium]|nr:sugar phosphate isomerase/epimerase [Clostridia bacterium]